MFDNFSNYAGEIDELKTKIQFKGDATHLLNQLKILEKQADKLSVEFTKLNEIFSKMGNTQGAEIAVTQQEMLLKTLKEVTDVTHASSAHIEDLDKAYFKLAKEIANTNAAYNSLRKELTVLNTDKQVKELYKLEEAYDKMTFSLKKAVEQKERWTSNKNIERANVLITELTKEEQKVKELTDRYNKLLIERDNALRGVKGSRSISDINKDLRLQAQEIRNVTAQVTKYKREVREATTALSDLSRPKWLVEVTKRAAAYASIYISIYGLVNAAKNAVQAMSELDTQVRTMSAVLDLSSVKAKNLQDNLMRLAETYGVNVKEVGDLAIELGRAGVAYENIVSASRVALTMAMMTGDSFNVASSALVTYMTNYKKLIETVYNTSDAVSIIGNKLMYIANASKLSVQDISTIANYAVAAAKSMGLTIDALGALQIALSNAGNNASTIGTSIRRLQKIIYGTTEDTKKLFQELGISQEYLAEQIRKGADGTKAGLEASNQAFLLFINKLVNMTDEEFNRVTADMDVLARQTLTQLRNNGQAILTETGKVASATKDQLNQALLIANSYANSWQRIKDMAIKALNAIKPVLDSVIAGMAKIANLFASDEEQKLSSLSERLLELTQRLKAMDEAGLSGTSTYKALTAQVKVLKAEISKLNKEMSEASSNKWFFETINKELGLNKSLSSAGQVIPSLIRYIPSSSGLDFHQANELYSKSAEEGLSNQEAKQWVTSLTQALELAKKNKAISAEQYQIAEQYISLIRNHYHFVENEQHKITEQTKQNVEQIDKVKNSVSVIDTHLLSIYGKLVKSSIALKQFGEAAVYNTQLFSKAKEEAEAFSNFLDKEVNSNIISPDKVEHIKKLLNDFRTAKTTSQASEALSAIQQTISLGKLNNEKWVKGTDLYVSNLIKGLSKVIELEKAINDAKEAQIRKEERLAEKQRQEAIRNQNLYQRIHNLYTQYLPAEQQLVEWKNKELAIVNKITDALLKRKALNELEIVYEYKKANLITEQTKLYYQQFKAADALYKKLNQDIKNPYDELDIQKEADRLTLINGLAGKKLQDALYKLDVYYSKKKQKLYETELKQQKEAYEKWLKENYGLYLDMIDSVGKALQSDLFDLMTGKFRNLGDFVKHLFKDVGKSIANSFAKSLAQSITKTITDNMTKNLVPSFEQFFGQQPSQIEISPTATTLNAANPQLNYPNAPVSNMTTNQAYAGVARNVLASAGTGYVLGNLGDTISSSKTKSGTYGAVGGAVGATAGAIVGSAAGPAGMVAGSLVGGTIGASVGAVIGGAIGERVLKWAGYSFNVTMNAFNTAYLNTLKHYEKKSWFDKRSTNKIEEASSYVKAQIQDFFTVYDKILADLGKVGEHVEVAAGNYSSEDFSLAVLDDFISKISDIPKQVEVQYSKLQYVMTKGSIELENLKVSTLVKNPDLKKVENAWKDYAKSLGKKLGEVATQAFADLHTFITQMSVWSVQQTRGKIAGYQKQMELSQRELSALKEQTGMQFVSNSYLTAHFNELMQKALQNSPTPEVIAKWEALGEALQNATNAEQAYKQAVEEFNNALHNQTLSLMQVYDTVNNTNYYNQEVLKESIQILNLNSLSLDEFNKKLLELEHTNKLLTDKQQFAINVLKDYFVAKQKELSTKQEETEEAQKTAHINVELANSYADLAEVEEQYRQKMLNDYYNQAMNEINIQKEINKVNEERIEGLKDFLSSLKDFVYSLKNSIQNTIDSLMQQYPDKNKSLEYYISRYNKLKKDFESYLTPEKLSNPANYQRAQDIYSQLSNVAQYLVQNQEWLYGKVPQSSIDRILSDLGKDKNKLELFDKTLQVAIVDDKTGKLEGIEGALKESSNDTTINVLKELNKTIDLYNKQLLSNLGIGKKLTLNDVYPDTSLMQNWAIREFYNILPDDQKSKLDYWVKVIGSEKEQGIGVLYSLNDKDRLVAEKLLDKLSPNWSKDLFSKATNYKDVLSAITLNIDNIVDKISSHATNPAQEKNWLNNFVIPFSKAYLEAEKSKAGQFLLEAVSDNYLSNAEMEIIKDFTQKYRETGNIDLKAYSDFIDAYNKNNKIWSSPSAIATVLKNTKEKGNWGDTIKQYFPNYDMNTADKFGGYLTPTWKWSLYNNNDKIRGIIQELANIEVNAVRKDSQECSDGGCYTTTHLLLDGVDVTAKYNDLEKYLHNLGLWPQFDNSGHLVSLATGGFTGDGTFTDSTGYRVAGIVHNGEWVAPKWMVDSNPAMFGMLESMRASNKPGIDVNVAVDLSLIRETNSILVQQTSIQKKMLRLLQKFDEEGLKCVS